MTTNCKPKNVNSFLLLMLLAGIALTIFLFNPTQPSLAQLDNSRGNDRKLSPELEKPHTQSVRIVRTIVSLAHTLGLDVMAEGVETAAQWSQLTTLNCEYNQGYFFATPLSADAATKYLAESPGAPALVQSIDGDASVGEPAENYFM